MSRHRAVVGMISIALVTGSVAACGGGSTGGSNAAETLTVVASAAPATLDPVKANVGSDNWFVNLAYDTLLRLGPDGDVQPGLAVRWGYVGKNNTTFELKLREGVKFADGTPLTAQAVAASLDYARKNGLNAATWSSAIESVTATGPLTVRINCSTPHPVLPLLLDQIQLVGSVISPKGLADPSKMGANSFGAGPYVLDSAQSASGDHYTYTPNPNYWDKSRIHWKKVVIKVVTNPSSALDAVKTGQADLTALVANQADTAKSSGLAVINAPIAFAGVNLADRDGTLAKPLADVRVRQALNYAVDRQAITQAIFKEYGQPTTQLSLPGLDGYVPDYDNRYPYDPAKAKKLLAEAGYPDGFTLRAEVQGVNGFDLLPQAVFQQWKQVGVTVNVVTDTTVGAFLSNAMSKSFPALGFAYGGLPTYLTSLDWMLPHASPFNPFASQDPKLAKLLESAASAPQARQPGLYREAMRYVVDQAWFVAVSRQDQIFAFDGKKLDGVTVASGYLPDLAWEVKPR
ncbi:ABC transporter substrate-binding protein [Streptosporangium saharense]|uniref:Peptide/nickel transport system substrate-binding protein n=1 Tax=Streptosporangium saharense TaxID=1706840 RepID=A0A7W7QHE9_9ACTN|nr:ABC transporter substrate-binding protein [Streptosporangium saharense]MBB4913429.1 peptide/nickel transport system substrate-binding protein [Streptosporangium saharense]